MDERLYDPDELVIGDGCGDLALTVSFRDLEPALESRSSGDAVNSVNSLWVVLYKVADGDTVFYKKVLASSLADYKINQDGNSAEPTDKETGDNFDSTGEKTPHASFT
ncbi:MAG: hypothetical protein K2K94_07455, partial [Muribaculaceae bacterium]|nr:hypothetical protein [Muribaculaceae bacterium]